MHNLIDEIELRAPAGASLGAAPNGPRLEVDHRFALTGPAGLDLG
jgi:hypothetical protein